MDQLEKYILDHRESFDEQEPSVGHFNRFEEKLEQESGKKRILFNRSLVLKLAAVILVLVTVSLFLFDFSKIRREGREEYGISTEIRDAIDYYNGVTDAQMGTINKLACCGQDVIKIYNDAQGQIGQLDASAGELKDALRQNPNDERLQSALLQNQQMKEKVLDNMIEQLKNAKN